MPDHRRLLSAGFFALALLLPAWSKPPAPKETEYQRADTNLYLHRDVVAADPDAVILPETSFREVAGAAGAPESYFFTPRKKAPQEIYLREVLDWLEPITPPSMPLTPADLGIAPDAMQIREMQGDVQVALPSSPSSFAPATEGQTIPDGALVKTGANGTAAILLGGINSVRLAPNSEVAAEQTVSAELRSTRVDLKSGAAFSKVGLRPGQKQDYEVRTAQGTAKAKGTDFLTIATDDHTDVFIAQGTVEFDDAGGKREAEAHSDGKGELQVIQSAVAANAGQGPIPAVTDELTMAFNFIPTVNLKVKTLGDKASVGGKLTPQEEKYLGLLRRVPVLLKLARVEPPPPPPLPVVATPAPAPPVVTAPAPPPPVAAPAPPEAPETHSSSPSSSVSAQTPLVTQVDLSPPAPLTTATVPPPAKTPLRALLHVDGTIDFQGKTLEPAEFESALDEVMKTAPHNLLILRAEKDVPDTTLKSVIDLSRKAGLKKVAVHVIEPKKKEPAAVVKAAMKVHVTMAPRPEDLSLPATTNAPPMAGDTAVLTNAPAATTNVPDASPDELTASTNSPTANTNGPGAAMPDQPLPTRTSDTP